MITDEQVIAKYLELRDRKTAIENKHKLELMPFNDALKKFENYMGEQLTARGKNNVSTAAGTAYKKEVFLCEPTDLNTFINFAIDNDQSMLDIKPSKTGVKAWMEKQQLLQAKQPVEKRKPIVVPGVKTDWLLQIIFRKV